MALCRIATRPKWRGRPVCYSALDSIKVVQKRGQVAVGELCFTGILDPISLHSADRTGVPAVVVPEFTPRGEMTRLGHTVQYMS